MIMLAKRSFWIAPLMLCTALTLSISISLVPMEASAAEREASAVKTEVSMDGRQFVLAARFGHERVIKNKLSGGIDIDTIDELGNTALIVAAAENQKSILKLLLAHNANVNVQSNDGTTALMNAALHGNLDIATALIEAGGKVDLHKSDGDTALVGAVQYGHLPMAELLLTAGANPNVTKAATFKDGAGFTPLMYAAQHGLKGAKGDWNAITKSLLKHGANTNLARANGDTALTIAQWHQHNNIIDLLISAGARDETHYAALSNEDALVKAARIGDLAKTQLLLKQATDVNYRDKNTGVTPLITGIYYGNIDVVRTLVERGANVNHAPWGLKEQRIASSSVSFKERELLRSIARSDTALLLAVHNNFTEIAGYLIAHGAKIPVANRKLETPSLIAVRNGNTKLVQLLLDHGANPDRATIEKKVDRYITRIHKKEMRPSLLIEAAKGGHINTLAVLLKAGADANIQDNDGITPIFKASEQGYVMAVALLLAHQADPNLYDNIGRTPLMIASRNGYQNIVEALVAHDANVNAIEQLEPNSHRDISIGGMTALIYASRGGHAEIAEFLLKHGADRRLSSNTGETALGVAKQRGFSKIEQLLAGAPIDD